MLSNTTTYRFCLLAAVHAATMAVGAVMLPKLAPGWRADDISALCTHQQTKMAIVKTRLVYDALLAAAAAVQGKPNHDQAMNTKKPRNARLDWPIMRALGSLPGGHSTSSLKPGVALFLRRCNDASFSAPMSAICWSNFYSCTRIKPAKMTGHHLICTERKIIGASL